MDCQDKISLEQLPNDQEGNERFHVVFIDGEKQALQSGYIRSTQGPLTEQEIREFFAKGGQPEAEVNEMFRLARLAARVRFLAEALGVQRNQVIPLLRTLPPTFFPHGHTDDAIASTAVQNLDAIRKGLEGTRES